MKLKIVLIIIGLVILAGAIFFIFTSTTSSPTELSLHIPKEEGKNDTAYSHVRTKLTLLLLKDNKVFGYYGNFITDGKIVPAKETNNLIQEGWKMFSKDSLVVLIKPAKDASYKTTVDILDQMTKNGVEKYSMADPNKKEKEFLKLDE